MSVRGEILDNLETALGTILVMNGYETDVKSVYREATSMTEIDPSTAPALLIDNDPVENREPSCQGYERMRMTIQIDGFIVTSGNLPESYNAFVVDLRNCLLTANLGTNVIYSHFGEFRSLTGDNQAFFTQEFIVVYYYGTASTPGTDIHGPNDMFDNSRSALKTLMDNLKSAMVTANENPRPAAVYDSHEQVKMSLPAISVGILEGDTHGNIAGASAGIGGIIAENYDIGCEIRVHTNWEGEYLDELTLSRLLNSAINWIEDHRNLSAAIPGFCGLRIKDVSLSGSFEESLTIGGRFLVDLIVNVDHTQG